MVEEDNMRLVFNLTRFEMQYPGFIQTMAPKIADETILKEIKKRMGDFRYSQKIIDSTRIQNFKIGSEGNLDFEVISDYKSDSGFDVSKAREEGTIDHFVKPIIAKALAFIVQNGTAFSKGHWVKGITASNVITQTTEEMQPVFQQRLNQETDNFLKGEIA